MRASVSRWAVLVQSRDLPWCLRRKWSGRLIGNLKRRAIFRPRLAMIVDPRGRDVRVPEPFLDLGNVGLMIEGIGRSRGTEGVGANLES